LLLISEWPCVITGCTFLEITRFHELLVDTGSLCLQLFQVDILFVIVNVILLRLGLLLRWLGLFGFLSWLQGVVLLELA
jgi:hypothetical protein